MKKTTLRNCALIICSLLILLRPVFSNAQETIQNRKLEAVEHTPWEPTTVQVYNVAKRKMIGLDARKTTYSYSLRHGGPVIAFIAEESGAAWFGGLASLRPNGAFYIETEHGIAMAELVNGPDGAGITWYFDDSALERKRNSESLDEFISLSEKGWDYDSLYGAAFGVEGFKRMERTNLGQKLIAPRGGGGAHALMPVIREVKFEEELVKLVIEGIYTEEVWIDLNTREVTKRTELAPAETAE